MAAQRRIGLIFLVVIAGLVVSSLLCEILGKLLAAGRSQDLISRGRGPRRDPTADLSFRRLPSVTARAALTTRIPAGARPSLAARAPGVRLQP